MKKTIELARVVFSNSGHDKGNYYLVLRALDTKFCEVINGTSHKIKSPKRKNIKHLNTCNFVVQSIADKLIQGTQVNDSEISHALHEFKKLNSKKL